MKKDLTNRLKFGGKMYSILIYDIHLDKKGKRVLREIFKTAKKYMIHIQNSVFEGELSPDQYKNLSSELKKYLREGLDSCIIFSSRNIKWMDKDFIVKETENKTDTFL